MNKFSIVAALIAGLVCTTACDSPEGTTSETDSLLPAIKLNSNANGETVELQQGQSLTITLSANPSAGYSWMLADGGYPVLTWSDDPVFDAVSSPNQGVGGSISQSFVFRAIESGQSRVRLHYGQPWDQSVTQVFSLDVVVH